MTDEHLPQVGGGGFEGLKKVNDFDAEYWSARDLQPLLGYSQWRRFENAIKKAITSCEQSGNDPDHHFAGAGKPIPGGKGAVQVVPDYHLSVSSQMLAVCVKTWRGRCWPKSRILRSASSALKQRLALYPLETGRWVMGKEARWAEVATAAESDSPARAFSADR